MKLLCICDEEMCFCTNTVEVPDAGYPPPEVACDECKAGHHVWSPGGERS